MGMLKWGDEAWLCSRVEGIKGGCAREWGAVKDYRAGEKEASRVQGGGGTILTGRFLPDPESLWILGSNPSLHQAKATSLSSADCLGIWKPICKYYSEKKLCVNGKLCAHRSPNFHWFLVFSSINPKCAFHFIFPAFEDICLAFALYDGEGGKGVPS